MIAAELAAAAEQREHDVDEAILAIGDFEDEELELEPSFMLDGTAGTA